MAAVSYNAIYSIQHNSMNKGILFDLDQQAVKLTSNYTNLLLITQQLTPQGDVGSLVKNYFSEREPYGRSVLSREISSSIGLVTFTNFNIGLVMYYCLDDKLAYFNNLPLRSSFSPEALPVLSSYMDFDYQPPHTSISRFYKDQVISVTRKVDFSDGRKWIIYAEVKCDIDRDINKLSSSANMPYMLALIDNGNQVRYCSSQNEFRTGSVMNLENDPALKARYKWNMMQSDYGYRAAILVTMENYNKEIQRWKRNMFLIFGIVLLITEFVALVLFRLIYKPFRVFEVEMEALGRGNMSALEYQTGIREFDKLFEQFNGMKQRIQQLLIDVEVKEKRKHQLEIEKLAYQINPHFLMNSLNSIHWMARMRHQEEIDRVICTLNLLLSYNLGKSKENATLRTELKVLEAYLELQKLKYDFTVAFHIQEGSYLDRPVARFILQPIAENAVCHGMDEHGKLEVEIKEDTPEGVVLIRIKDNGKGLSPELLETLRSQDALDSRQMGCGIGLRYVRSMLESFYGDKARMEIESAPLQGTAVTIVLPRGEEEAL
jgi:two-component system sensor histidine kinase YesM